MVKVNSLKGYEEVLDVYYVLNEGAIYSNTTKRNLKSFDNGKGYLVVSLKVKGERKWKKAYVHRLVALSYVDNPNLRKEVNHIDEDKQNNSFDNLQWVTREENNNYGSRTNKQRETMTEKIYVYDYLLKYIGEYNGMNEATEEVLGYSQNRGRNGRIQDYFFLNETIDKVDVLEIINKSGYKAVVVENTMTGEKKYFARNRDARRHFANKVNITDAIKHDWLVWKKYKIYNLDYKALL